MRDHCSDGQIQTGITPIFQVQIWPVHGLVLPTYPIIKRPNSNWNCLNHMTLQVVVVGGLTDGRLAV